jgi:hypothetical protein
MTYIIDYYTKLCLKASQIWGDHWIETNTEPTFYIIRAIDGDIVKIAGFKTKKK